MYSPSDVRKRKRPITVMPDTDTDYRPDGERPLQGLGGSTSGGSER